MAKKKKLEVMAPVSEQPKPSYRSSAEINQDYSNQCLLLGDALTKRDSAFDVANKQILAIRERILALNEEMNNTVAEEQKAKA